MKIIDVKKILSNSLPDVSDYIPSQTPITFIMTAGDIGLLKDWAKEQGVKKPIKEE